MGDLKELIAVAIKEQLKPRDGTRAAAAVALQTIKDAGYAVVPKEPTEKCLCPCHCWFVELTLAIQTTRLAARYTRP